MRTNSVVGYVTYALLRDHARSFSNVGAYQPAGAMRLGTGAGAHDIQAAHATWDLFPTLGVHPVVGRFFGADEDHPPKGERVAVISSEFWQRDMGGDEDVVGKTMTIEGAIYRIVGVAPRGFTGPERVKTDVWLPMSLLAPRPDWPTTYQAQWLNVVGRLAPGANPEQAGVEATTILRGAYDGPEASMRTLRASMRPLWANRSGGVPPIANVSRWLMGVAVAVLLIACANVANLFVARTRRRRREIAVRVALGASRGALVRLLLAEATILALAGAAAALAVAAVGGRLMRVTLLSTVAWDGQPIDARVFAFTLVLAVAVGVLVAVAPALEATRVSLTSSLKTGQQDGGGRRAALRSTLSIVQSALSVVLLIGAALFVVSLSRVRAIDLGFQPARVLRVEPDLAPSGPGPSSFKNWKVRSDQAFSDAIRALARLPWIEHAAVSVGSPFGYGFGVSVTIPGRDSLPAAPGGAHISAVSSEYFSALGMTLRRGRLFTSTDRAGSARVAIVGETMAKLVWPGEDPIGKCLLIGDRSGDTLPPCASVVGVVADVHRESLREPGTMQYYVPLGQEVGIAGSVLIVRPRIPMSDARSKLTRAIAAMPQFSYARISTIQEAIDPELRPWKLGATMFGVFGLLALVVAAVGLYSVIAYLVENRTRELGVRIALGATRERVTREVIGRGVGTTIIGVIFGIVAALVCGRYVRPLLYGVTERDPLVLSTVVIVVVAIAAVASWVPARRAGRVDPVVALRTD